MASQAIPLLYETNSVSVFPGGAIPGAVTGAVTGTTMSNVHTVDNRPALNLRVSAPGAPGVQSTIKNPA